jgi:DNA (cytosine-5)-methyltransferase 1
LENVPGLLTSNQGRDFGSILLALGDAGLPHIEWKVLDSQFFGVPQRRRRVFIVASAEHPGRRPLLTESEGRRWHPASFRAQRKGTSSGAEEGTIGFSHNQGLDIQPSTRVFPTLRVGGGGLAVATPDSD